MKTRLLFLMLLLSVSFGYSQVISVAVVGEAAGGWPGDAGNPGPLDVHQMVSTDGENWTLSDLTLTNWNNPGGGIKFRANNDWVINWGSAIFPSGTGTQGGADIECIAGTYSVEFNSTTGVYAFIGGTVLPTVMLVGTAVSDPGSLTMSATSATEFRLTNVTLLDGTAQIDIDGGLFGGDTFPDGAISDPSLFIPVTAGTYSLITVNIDSGAYSFVAAPLIPPVSIVGDGVGGWPPFVGPDPNQLTSADGVNYAINGLTCVVGPAKFRQDNDWAISWGAVDFPSGTALLSGENIAITTAGTYDVTFNRTTGAYAFSQPTIALVGAATPGGWPTGTPGEIDPSVLTSTDGINFTLSSIVLSADICKFRANNAWAVNWGSADFPVGVGTQDGANIAITTASTYGVTLNRLTGEYAFIDLLATTSFNNSTFKVTPNPTTNVWNFSSTNKTIETIQIVDILGKVVMTIAPKNTLVQVDASSLTSGLYFAKITSGNATETVKLVKN